MNRPALDAALRLSARLPCTVHVRQEPPEPENREDRAPPKRFRQQAAGRLAAKRFHRIANGGAMARTLPSGERVKRCSGHKVDHPIEAFSQGSGADGLSHHCREWHREYRLRRAELSK